MRHKGCYVMYLKAFFRKTTLWTIASLGLAFGVLVYATIDRTVVVSEQLVVIPDSVTSDTWAGLNNSLQSDVLEQSLYQNFSKENSAYIDSSVVSEPQLENPTVEVINSSSTDVGEEVNSSVNENSDVPDTETDIPVIIEPNSDTEPAELPSEPVAEPSEPAVEVDVETSPINEVNTETVSEEAAFATPNLLWGLLSDATVTKFPLAQEVITTYLTTSTEVDLVAEEVPPSEVSESVPEVDMVEENAEVVEESDGADLEVVAAENNQVDVPADDVDAESTPEIVTLEDACAGDSECKMYSSVFSGFAMPEFESDKFLTSAQLRLSLAAKTLTEDVSGPQRFVIEYRYSNDTNWSTATIIDIEDEVSNSINGGYYLISLAKPSHQSQLSLLQVRVSYQGNINYLDKAYVESLWLEVTSSKFYEETDPAFLDDSIDYSRDLEEPKFHDLNNTDLDLTLNELPAFTLSYSPQEGFLKKVFNYIFNENEYSVDRVNLTDSTGAIVDVPIKIIYQDEKVWTVQFMKRPQKLIPGKYKLQLLVNENETIFVDEFEFYWGVLAVNTEKSMYFPNEPVKLNLAALTDRGDTNCDAFLELKIINPKNEFFEVPVEQSGSCAKNNVTDVPDYLANFNDERFIHFLFL